jgi:hypothetical protein
MTMAAGPPTKKAMGFLPPWPWILENKKAMDSVFRSTHGLFFLGYDLKIKSSSPMGRPLPNNKNKTTSRGC